MSFLLKFTKVEAGEYEAFTKDGKLRIVVMKKVFEDGSSTWYTYEDNVELMEADLVNSSSTKREAVRVCKMDHDESEEDAQIEQAVEIIDNFFANEVAELEGPLTIRPKALLDSHQLFHRHAWYFEGGEVVAVHRTDPFKISVAYNRGGVRTQEIVFVLDDTFVSNFN